MFVIVSTLKNTHTLVQTLVLKRQMNVSWPAMGKWPVSPACCDEQNNNFIKQRITARLGRLAPVCTMNGGSCAITQSGEAVCHSFNRVCTSLCGSAWKDDRQSILFTLRVRPEVY